MESLYNVYFGGEILPGEELATVRDRVAQMFKANQATLDTLFNGELHLVKRDCDKATALKYKQALEKAGARSVIKPADNGAVDEASPGATDTPMSAADRIAALAAAPDLDAYRSDAAEDTAADRVDTAQATPTDAEEDLNLAPPESEVLRPEERAPDVTREVDTGDLAVDAVAERLAAPAPPPPAAPDVSHLSMGDVGEDIPSLHRSEPQPAPSTDALSLSPEGTDFSDCQKNPPAAPDLDLSSLDVAPEGSEVLEEKYRQKPVGVAPETNHLTLEE